MKSQMIIRLRELLLAAAFTFPAIVAIMPQVAQAARPNIVVILADDVGWGDLGCYGATKIKTPHLDALAEGGMRFTNAYAPAACCTPTRYALLTGQYPWRRNATGLNKGVANGGSPLLIPVDMPTLPGILQKAGYHTGAVGKWHLGFTHSKPDYNKDLSPGPMEVGFAEFFGFPATNDRVPTVFVRGHHVVNLDPADPIRYSYDKDEALAQGLKATAAGRQRIGWMSGGKSAMWKDIDIAHTLTAEAVAFIERHHKEPFFLYFAPHDCHAPTIPHPRFAGTSGLGPRADMIHELDWSVGELMRALERTGTASRTLVIFSSDNGAYVEEENGHRPNGPFRGQKSQLWEGGSREPFIARWPERIKPGVSDALACLVDLPATVAAVLNIKLPDNAAPDSFNLLPVLSGDASAKARDHIVLMSGTGALALRQGPWKFIPDLATVGGWKPATHGEGLTGPGLFNLEEDPGEKTNVASQHSEVVERLGDLLQKTRNHAAAPDGG